MGFQVGVICMITRESNTFILNSLLGRSTTVSRVQRAVQSHVQNNVVKGHLEL
jgi:hypothetical protein